MILPARYVVQLTVASSLLGIGASPSRAQDPFEIQVYEYPTVPRGRWNLETHFNYTVRGTRQFEGPVAPSQHQTHLTFELTRGITDLFELAGYLVLANRPGAGPEYVGWRVRPRIRAPDSWHLPVGLSLSTEVGFPRRVYEENSVTLEVRPIIERRFGRLQIDLNPVVGRALRGPGSGEGWDFEPGARVAVTASQVVDLSIEYYGALGPVDDFAPAAEQVHQFFGGGDLQLNPDVVLNVGLGLGATEAGNRTVLKLRLGWLF
jgi:hypothetical protein